MSSQVLHLVRYRTVFHSYPFHFHFKASLTTAIQELLGIATDRSHLVVVCHLIGRLLILHGELQGLEVGTRDKPGDSVPVLWNRTHPIHMSPATIPIRLALTYYLYIERCYSILLGCMHA